MTANNCDILYIHGMGGGEDSRIPGLLSSEFDVVVRTYDFDPDIASGQIASWVEECRPRIVVGESLGATHALCTSGIPVILVSPALNAPAYLYHLAFLCLIPGVKWLLGRIYKPRPGRRQPLEFTYSKGRKWKKYRAAALHSASAHPVFAFFGTRDTYRRTGVVSLRLYRRHFGDSYEVYEGTHFMENDLVGTLLAQRIRATLCECGKKA